MGGEDLARDRRTPPSWSTSHTRSRPAEGLQGRITCNTQACSPTHRNSEEEFQWPPLPQPLLSNICYMRPLSHSASDRTCLADRKLLEEPVLNKIQCLHSAMWMLYYNRAKDCINTIVTKLDSSLLGEVNYFQDTLPLWMFFCLVVKTHFFQASFPPTNNISQHNYPLCFNIISYTC